MPVAGKRLGQLEIGRRGAKSSDSGLLLCLLVIAKDYSRESLRNKDSSSLAVSLAD